MTNNVQTTQQKVGRPTKFDERTVAKLELVLQRGMSVLTACEYAKVDPSNYYRLMQSNEEFRNRMLDAKNFVTLLAGNRLVEILEKGADRDAAPLVKFTLERKQPDEYGAKPTVVVQQNNVGYTPPSWYTPQGEVKEAVVAEPQEVVTQAEEVLENEQ